MSLTLKSCESAVGLMPEDDEYIRLHIDALNAYLQCTQLDAIDEQLYTDALAREYDEFLTAAADVFHADCESEHYHALMAVMWPSLSKQHQQQEDQEHTYQQPQQQQQNTAYDNSSPSSDHDGLHRQGSTY